MSEAAGSDRAPTPAEQFEDLGFLALPGLIDPSWAGFFCRYVNTIVRSGALTADTQVPGSLVRYGDPLFDTLLDALGPDLEDRLGRSLLPTYSFLRVYFEHQSLDPHCDRPACEYTLTLHLGAQPETPWPVCLRDRHGRHVVAQLGPGDGLVYDGVNLLHWRGAFAGDWYAQVFLHYVDATGPYADRRFDGRSALGRPSVPSGPRAAEPAGPC